MSDRAHPAYAAHPTDNLRGVFFAMKYQIPVMLAAKGGNIVFTCTGNAAGSGYYKAVIVPVAVKDLARPTVQADAAKQTAGIEAYRTATAKAR